MKLKLALVAAVVAMVAGESGAVGSPRPTDAAAGKTQAAECEHGSRECYEAPCAAPVRHPLTNKHLRVAVREGSTGRSVFGFSDFGWRIIEHICQQRGLRIVQKKGPYSESPEELTLDGVEVLPAVFWHSAITNCYTPIEQPIAYATIELSAPAQTAAKFNASEPSAWPKKLRVAHVAGVLDTLPDYERWRRAAGVKAEIVDFDDVIPAMESVRRGECDLLLAAVWTTPSGFVRVREIRRRPTYLAVRNDLPTLRFALARDVSLLRLHEKAWLDKTWLDVFGTPVPENLVRLGVYLEPGLIERGHYGELRGYVNSYIMRIAELNDWLVDYVYCDYNDGLVALSKGQLDIMGGVTHTPKRQKNMLFSRFSAGLYQDFIYSRKLPMLSAETANLWQKAHVVMGPGEEARARLASVFAQYGVQATISEFPTAEGAISAYRSGAADALFSVAFAGAKSSEIVATFPAVPWYFVVAPNKEQLRHQLDGAVVRIQAQFPGFQEVQRYGHTPEHTGEDLGLTPSERAWLAVRTGEDRPVYVEMSPSVLLWKEWDAPHRRAEGVLVKYLDVLSKRTGLKFVVKPPMGQSVAHHRFETGEVDLWACYMADTSNLPAGGKRVVVFSNPTVCAVRRGVMELKPGETRFAVMESDSTRREALTRRGFGDEVVLCRTEEECFDAIRNKHADATIAAPRSALVMLRRLNALEDIEIRNVAEITRLEDVAFEISPKANPMLAKILVKAMHNITPMDCEQMVREMVYENIGHTRFTTLQFVVLVASVAVLALSVLMVIALQLALSARRAAVAASAAGEAKTQFLSTISHEIRTPLNVLVGFADFLNQPGLSKDQVREYTDGINLSAQVLLSLINDVLDLSKLEAGKMDLSGQCNLQDLFAVLKVMFAGMARQKGLTFDMYLQPSLPTIGISAQRVRQVLFNLISNAVKYTEKGSVRVEGVGTLEASGDYVNVTFRVSDTGIGISPEKSQAVFNPFVQDMSRRGNKVFEGTGLGLAIVKRLVDAAGGTVALESRVGVGSVFSVYLPHVKVVHPEAKRPSGTGAMSAGTPSLGVDYSGNAINRAAAERAAHRREAQAEKEGKADMSNVETGAIGQDLDVLVVDDIALNLRVFSVYLKKLGVTDIRVAKSGAHALELVKEKKPDVVFTDMWMPQMDGSQLAEAIRALPFGNDLEIVAVTADADSAATFRLDAFNAIMTKPVTEEKIVKALRNLREGGGG